MLKKASTKQDNKKYLSQVNRIIFSLLGLAIIAIAFTLSMVRLQSGVTVYLGALSIWSRAQVEAVRFSDLYAQTGDEAFLKQAQKWYRIPIGDMNGRLALERDPISIELAREGFLQAMNHPDDVSTMILMFRAMKNAPYMRDAVSAWRDSDTTLIALGDLLQKLEKEWNTSPRNTKKIQALATQMELLNDKLTINAEQFREKMSSTSRALLIILYLLSFAFFVLLFVISTFLILRLTKSLRHSELKFRKTFENAGMGIAQLDINGRVIEANDAFCKILKFDKGDIYEKYYEQLVEIESLELNGSHLKQVKDINSSVSIESQIFCGDGSIARAKINLSMFAEPKYNANQYICIIEDVSDQHRLSLELTRQARQDDLTGLSNRRAFKDHIKDAAKRAIEENFIHCLCFIDLDRFKIVNDTSGHIAGDAILQQVAKRLSSKIRKHDLLARLGGDEFGLILDCCEPERALKIADSLRIALTDMPFVWQGKKFNIGCSIGIVAITSKSQDLEELLKAADLACHLAKEQGRDRVILTYEGDQNIKARRAQYEWISKIRAALDNNLLFLDAQKIVSTSTPDLVRLEVLIRMLDEQNETVSPGEFLPAAERYGSAHLIDRWVINEVCSSFAKYKKAWESIDACHVNISGRSFDQSDFTEFTLNTIKAHNFPANKLCFEITETAAVSNLSDIHDFMNELRNIGSSFALDDFGSGLASFSYLKQIPVEYLKIDGAFVQNMASDEVDTAMVKAICDIGHALDKIMVAEFVEDQAALDLLEKMGVEYLQGYYLHRPERFEKVIESLSVSARKIEP